jgi:hypothetical protein
MTAREKVLYHQIHPLKLATDISVGYLSYLLLWRQRIGLGRAVLLQFLPALLVSGILIRWADLEPQRRSALGHYVARSMTPAMQAVRMAGNLALTVGAWRRRVDLLVLGHLLVLVGWLRGRLGPRRTA